MTKVAIVIPYYQESPDILATCLKSIAAQRVADGVVMDVIVVDDGSPASPDADVAAVSFPEPHRVRVVRQPNGGVAAARNRGLDNVEDDTDFVAFIDSDDRWAPNHLPLALRALGSDCDVYFCDSELEPGRTVFGVTPTPFFSLPESEAPYRRTRDDVFEMTSTAAAYHMTEGYLAHTSALVYRWKPLADLRFEASIRFGGEDHLMWVLLMARARAVCFSRSVESLRGDAGISLYRAPADRVSSRNIRKEACRGKAFDLIAAAPGLERRTRRLARGIARAQWLEVAGIMLGPSGMRAGLERGTRRLLSELDPGFWRKLPARWAFVLAGKVIRRRQPA